MTESAETIIWREKLDALVRAARYWPAFTAVIIVLGTLAAALEGVALFRYA